MHAEAISVPHSRAFNVILVSSCRVSAILRHINTLSLTTYSKTHEMRSERLKTAFLGLFGRILNVCAMCYMAFAGLFVRI